MILFIRLRQNTLQLAAGMNGGANAPKLEQRRRVGFGEFHFDTPQLAAGRFIGGHARDILLHMKPWPVKAKMVTTAFVS